MAHNQQEFDELIASLNNDIFIGTSINLSSKGLSNLDAAQLFEALSSASERITLNVAIVDLSDNDLTEIYVPMRLGIIKLFLENNRISKFNLCYSEKLSIVNLSKNALQEVFIPRHMPISILNLSDNNILTTDGLELGSEYQVSQHCVVDLRDNPNLCALAQAEIFSLTDSTRIQILHNFKADEKILNPTQMLDQYYQRQTLNSLSVAVALNSANYNRTISNLRSMATALLVVNLIVNERYDSIAITARIFEYIGMKTVIVGPFGRFWCSMLNLSKNLKKLSDEIGKMSDNFFEDYINKRKDELSIISNGMVCSVLTEIQSYPQFSSLHSFNKTRAAIIKTDTILNSEAGASMLVQYEARARNLRELNRKTTLNELALYRRLALKNHAEYCGVKPGFINERRKLGLF